MLGPTVLSVHARRDIAHKITNIESAIAGGNPWRKGAAQRGAPPRSEARPWPFAGAEAAPSGEGCALAMRYLETSLLFLLQGAPGAGGPPLQSIVAGLQMGALEVEVLSQFHHIFALGDRRPPSAEVVPFPVMQMRGK